MRGLHFFHAVLMVGLNTALKPPHKFLEQEELRLMQRSSFYLEIRRHNLSPPADEPQDPLQLSDSIVWTLIDKQRLQSAKALAKTRVTFLLTLQELLYEELIEACRELKAFNDQGLADGDTAAHVQQRLLQTHQDLNDFESRMTRNAATLHLRNQLIPNKVHSSRIILRASLIIKLPVMFNRLKSCVTSNIVHLHWEVADMQSEDLNQEFKIHVKSLHPTSAEKEEVSQSVCKSYDVQVKNLKPNRYYEFSVRRVDIITLVSRQWTDTIILATFPNKICTCLSYFPRGKPHL
uniref:Fibronectin type-III domain-containing protein n=1 Tax=Cyclopterus lumpus TaxID=8103 RepID=A0A8C2YY76_CYCLU